MNINNEMGIDNWSATTGHALQSWADNATGKDSVDYAEDMAALLQAACHMLSQIDESVAAYEAGAANTGNPDAVVSEVKRILFGLDPVPDLSDHDKALNRRVTDLFCAECGTHKFPFVVHDETEVCLSCHVALTDEPEDTSRLVEGNEDDPFDIHTN